MSSSALEVAVVGSTGVTGEQVLAALDASDLVIGALRAYGSASRSPRVDTVTFRGQSVGVEPLSALGEGRPDLAILCVPPSVAGKLAPGLVARGVVVVDARNATVGVLDAPLAFPWSTALPEGVAVAGAVRLPSASGALLSTLAAPLRAVGLTGISGLIALPASARGRAGMEELGQQVVAAMNNQDPARRVFVDGLAFDALPEDVPMDEWSGAEQLAAAEVAALTGLDPVSVAVQIGIFPLFAGVTAGLHLRGVGLDDAEQALRGAPGLVAITRTARLRPRAAIGKAGVWWGRLRADPAGEGVHVWAVTDDVFAAGTAAARTAAALSAAGLLGVA